MRGQNEPHVQDLTKTEESSPIKTHILKHWASCPICRNQRKRESRLGQRHSVSHRLTLPEGLSREQVRTASAGRHIRKLDKFSSSDLVGRFPHSQLRKQTVGSIEQRVAHKRPPGLSLGHHQHQDRSQNSKPNPHAATLAVVRLVRGIARTQQLTASATQVGKLNRKNDKKTRNLTLQKMLTQLCVKSNSDKTIDFLEHT